MGMTRGTALVASIARVTQLTGVQDLANLESTSELAVTDLLVTASDAIYDQLDANGVDPTALTNAQVFERSVAWHALALLVLLDYVGLPEGLSPPTNEVGQADPFAWSDPHFSRVRPRTADADPRRANESLPAVANRRRFPAFGERRRVWDDLPEIQ